MHLLSNKKNKKSDKSSQRHLSLGIPANVAVGPLGFRAELGISSEGEQDRSYRDLVANRPDLTVVSDERDTKASRIIFRHENEDQVPPAPETSTSAAIVDGNEHDGLMSEHFNSCYCSRCSSRILCPPTREYELH